MVAGSNINNVDSTTHQENSRATDKKLRLGEDLCPSDNPSLSTCKYGRINQKFSAQNAQNKEREVMSHPFPPSILSMSVLTSLEAWPSPLQTNIAHALSSLVAVPLMTRRKGRFQWKMNYKPLTITTLYPRKLSYLH